MNRVQLIQSLGAENFTKRFDDEVWKYRNKFTYKIPTTDSNDILRVELYHKPYQLLKRACARQLLLEIYYENN